MSRRPVTDDPQLLLKDSAVIRAVSRRVFNSPLLISDQEREFVFERIVELSDLLERRAREALRKQKERPSGPELVEAVVPPAAASGDDEPGR